MELCSGECGEENADLLHRAMYRRKHMVYTGLGNVLVLFTKKTEFRLFRINVVCFICFCKLFFAREAQTESSNFF